MCPPDLTNSGGCGDSNPQSFVVVTNAPATLSVRIAFGRVQQEFQAVSMNELGSVAILEFVWTLSMETLYILGV